MNIRNEVNLIKDQIISWRRYFHENPELSFKEFNTAKKTINIKALFDLYFNLQRKVQVGLGI